MTSHNSTSHRATAAHHQMKAAADFWSREGVLLFIWAAHIIMRGLRGSTPPCGSNFPKQEPVWRSEGKKNAPLV